MQYGPLKPQTSRESAIMHLKGSPKGQMGRTTSKGVITKAEMVEKVKKAKEEYNMQPREVYQMALDKGREIEGFGDIKQKKVQEHYENQKEEKQKKKYNILSQYARDTIGAVGDSATGLGAFAGKYLGRGSGRIAKNNGLIKLIGKSLGIEGDALDEKINNIVDGRENYLEDSRISKTTDADTDSLTYKGTKLGADILSIAAPGGLVKGASKTAKAIDAADDVARAGKGVLGVADDVVATGGSAYDDIAKHADDILSLGQKGLEKAGMSPEKAQKLVNFFSKVGKGVGEGVVDTALYDAQANQEIASADELKTGAAVGGAIPVLSKILGTLGKGAYNAAFNQAKASLNEQAIARYGKKSGELVMDEGLNGASLSKLKNSISTNLQNTRKAIEKSADNIDDLNVSDIAPSIKQDIIEKMTKGLNKNTQYYDDVVNNINDIVDFYMGENGKTTGREMIELVKDLNSAIPATAAKKSELVLNPGQSKTLIKSLKNSIQKYLDDEAGDILELYGDYSRQKLVEDIVQNVELRKMLGRQLLGGTVGGASLSAQDFANGNIPGGIKKLILGGLAGSVIAKQSSNPDVLLKLGKVLENSGGILGNANPIAASIIAGEEEQPEESSQ